MADFFSADSVSAARQQRARADQLARAYRLLPGALLATLGVSVLLVWGLDTHVAREGLYLWLAVVFLLSAARLWNWHAWRHSATPAAAYWTQHFYLGAALAGLTWGIAGFMFFPALSGGQMLMMFALAGIAAGGMGTLSILPWAYAFFLLAAILPFSLRLFMQQQQSYTLMGLMSLIFVTLLLLASRRAHALYTESQHLRLENEDMAEKLQALATTAITDSLTGAYNRNMLHVALPSEMERARRHDMPLSIILLDIDHFKHINDNHGHQVGDRTLVWITERICTHLRDSDLLFRWGGEEFMVLAPNADLEAAYVIADRMWREIEQSPLVPAGIITCSLGCSQFRPDDTPDSFIQRADGALYVAKENGRNRVERA